MENQHVNNGGGGDDERQNEAHDIRNVRYPNFNREIVEGIRTHLQSQFHNALSRTFKLFCLIPSKKLVNSNLVDDYNEVHKTGNAILYFLVSSKDTSMQLFQDHLGSAQVMKVHNAYVQELQRPANCNSIAQWVSFLTLTFIIDTRYQISRGADVGVKFYFGFNMCNSSLHVKSITSVWRTYCRGVLIDHQNIGGNVFCAPCCRDTCPHKVHPWHIDFGRFRPYTVSPDLKIGFKFGIGRYYFHERRHARMNDCAIKPLLIVNERVSLENIVANLDESIKRVKKTVYLVAVKTGREYYLYVGATVENMVPRESHWIVPANDFITPGSTLARAIRPNSDVYLLYKETFNEVEACLREALFLVILKYRKLDYSHPFETNQLINIRQEYTAVLSITPDVHIEAAVFLASTIPVLALTADELRTNRDWNFSGNFRPMERVPIPEEFWNYVRRKYPPIPVYELSSDSE